MKLTPLHVRIIIYIAAALLAYGLFRLWLSDRDDRLATESTLAQMQQTSRATRAIGTNAAAAQTQAHTIDVQLEPQRVEIIQRYEALKNEDATVRDAAAVAIPARMRDLARERRLARERLGGAAPGGAVDDGGAKGQR